MKHKSIVCGISRLAMFLLIMLSVSCSGESPTLFDSVPASSPVVASIDVETLFVQAGCRVTDDSVTITPELSALLIDKSTGELPAPITLFSQFRGVVDMTHTILFGIDDMGHDHLWSTDILDRTLFDDRISQVGEMVDSSDDLNLYTVGSWSLAVVGNRLWMAPKSPAQLKDDVIPLLSLKAADTMASQSGIIDFLTNGSTLNIAIRPSAVIPFVSDDPASHWSCVSAKVENSVIGLDFSVIESDGTAVSLAAGMQEVNTDFLRYVPQSFVFAAAAGFSADFNWQNVISASSLILGSPNSSYLSVIIPMLSKIDGTVSFAAGPASGAPAVARFGLDTWDMLAMVHLPQADVDNTLALLRSYAMIGGLQIENEGNITVLTMPDGNKIYAGNIDGYLAVSNREFDAMSSNSMTDVFLSRQAAMVLNVPAGSEIVKAFGLSCGFDINARMSVDNVQMRLSLNGSDHRVLQTLIELLADK